MKITSNPQPTQEHSEPVPITSRFWGSPGCGLLWSWLRPPGNIPLLDDWPMVEATDTMLIVQSKLYHDGLIKRTLQTGL